LLMLGEGMVDNANKPLGNAFVLGRGSNNRETRRLLTNRPRSSFVFEKSDSKRTTTRQQLDVQRLLSDCEGNVLGLPIASGSNLTFESEEGFPADSSRASLAHANWNFHHSQAQ